MGYGGNDPGINKMLQSLDEMANLPPIFWINKQKPAGDIRDWLTKQNAVLIDEYFDEVMLLIHSEFGLKHPLKDKFDKVFEGYFESYKKLSDKLLKSKDETPDTEALKEAALQADKSFDDWQSVMLEAVRYEKSDPDKANAIYLEGLKKFPDSGPLHHSYTFFLHFISKNYVMAEEYYKRAIEINLNYSDIVVNYAILLFHIRQNYDKAEEYYKKMIETTQDDANYLCNYAQLLFATGRQYEAFAMVKKALLQFGLSPDVLSESIFYLFANGLPETREENLSNLKNTLLDGGRSEYWDFSPNIERARVDGHPDIEWLPKLADVITEKADITTLDEWDKWRAID